MERITTLNNKNRFLRDHIISMSKSEIELHIWLSKQEIYTFIYFSKDTDISYVDYQLWKDDN